MGKKGKKFLSAIKKIFSPQSKKKKSELQISPPVASYAPSQPVHPFSPSEEIKWLEAEQEQSTHAYSVAVAEAAVAADQTAAEAVRFRNSANFAGNSREVAAIKIQTAFRGHLARRALRALKGLVRLKSLVLGKSVKRQAATTLRCMQTLARIQAQIRSRRIGMLEENQTLLRQHLRKRERELESLRMSEQWDESTQSKERIEASFLHKQEALMRRERALAYAFTHQWKTPSRSSNPTFMDANNPQWGWSWLERWTTPKPETRNPRTEQASINSNNFGQIDKSHSSPRYNRTPQRSIRPPSRNSPLTPIGTVKIRSASPRDGLNRSDDDTRSLISLQSERRRRHSVAGSSIRDDESLKSSATLPSYMAQTESAKAKNRFHGFAADTYGKDSANLVKKRLSFPLSPASVRRNSGPGRGDDSATGRNVEGR